MFSLTWSENKFQESLCQKKHPFPDVIQESSGYLCMWALSPIGIHVRLLPADSKPASPRDAAVISLSQVHTVRTLL